MLRTSHRARMSASAAPRAGALAWPPASRLLPPRLPLPSPASSSPASSAFSASPAFAASAVSAAFAFTAFFTFFICI